MDTRPQTSWLIDAVLFTGLIAAFFPDATGVEKHQWLGIFGGALAALHLAVHWPWVGAVTRRFYGRTSNTSRLYLLLDGGIMLGFLGMIGTGLMISTWLGLDLSRPGWWLTIHIFTSIVTLLMVVFKIALHWRWIASVGRKVLEPTPPLPVAAPTRGAVSRREFLGVIGLASFAAGMALTSGASRLLSGQLGEAGESIDESNAPTSAESAVSGTGGSASSSASSSSSSGVALSGGSPPQAPAQAEVSGSSTCSVACRHGCSFPGHCRRYTDANGNGLCDWGECA